MHRLSAYIVALSILCGSAWSSALAQDNGLTVFAAASMKNALDDIDAAYTAKTGIKIVVSYAASSALAKQIEQGAPADIFLSADTDWMDYAIARKTINESTRVNLLGNSIVLIAPKDSRIDHVTIGQGVDLAKLAGDGRIATGDVQAVPVGKYAKAALEKLGAWQAAAPKFAMAEIRDGGERARSADAGGARRSGTWNCLCDGCQGRTRRQDRRHFPGGFPPRHHLSGRGDRDRKS